MNFSESGNSKKNKINCSVCHAEINAGEQFKYNLKIKGNLAFIKYEGEK
jgi:hypothetical protein